MSFFKSELVQNEIDKITELQDKIYLHLFTFSEMTKEDKIDHVEMMEELLKRQQILFARLSLSDDPEAKVMKENVINSAKEMGFHDSDLNQVFKSMEGVIDTMKKVIRES